MSSHHGADRLIGQSTEALQPLTSNFKQLILSGTVKGGGRPIPHFGRQQHDEEGSATVCP